MRVLGVDPGLTRCGLGVVDSASGRAVTCVDVGVVRSGTDVALEHRLAAVADAVEDWVARHRPDVVAVERVFSQHNVRTVMGTAQASGVVALVAARAGLPVAFHTPSEVKAAVTGEGRAGKAQVASMVTRLLGLAETPRPADAADALALAICHCWRAPMQDRMADARARAEELARTHRARMSEAARTAASGAASGAAARTAAARTATVGSDVAGGRTARSGPARPDAARADAVRSDAVRSDAVGTDVTGPGAAGDAGVGQTSETWAEVVARRARSAGSPGARGTVRGRTGVRAQDHGGRPAAPGTSRRAPGAAQAERGAGAPDRQE